MNRGWWIVAAVVSSPLLAVVALVMVMTGTLTGGLSQAQGATTPGTCATPLPGNVSGPEQLTPKQSQNAATIIAVGKSLGVPPRGWVVAIATARQEAGLLNLASQAVPESLNFPHDGTAPGDHDSVGIFQQRTGWGTVAARMDVAQSARYFYTGGAGGERGLLGVPGWQSMSIAEAAQAVQVSAFPSAYAQWESLATATVAALGDVDPATATADCASVGATGKWTWPVSPPYTLTSGFGECGALWASCHTGQDFAVPTGTPVHAIADGVVRFVGWGGPYGNLTKIEHADGVWSWYAHQSKPGVTVGQQVTAGQTIGLSGATGNTTGPHVHLEVRINDRPIDPLKFLTDRVGKPLPDNGPVGTPPSPTVNATPPHVFRLATLNMLGDSHTRPGGNRHGQFPASTQRTRQAVQALESHNISVVGLQETEPVQVAQFRHDAPGWAVYHGSKAEAVAWRTDEFQLVAADTVAVPYFFGQTRQMPVVLLASLRTGGQMFVMSVHNPADAHGPAARWRAAAIRQELATITGLSAYRLPVFLVGDFNDHEKAYGPLTATGQLHAAGTAAPVDWLFGTLDTGFVHYQIDRSALIRRTTDHPLVYADAQ